MCVHVCVTVCVYTEVLHCMCLCQGKGGHCPNLHSVVHAKSGWLPMFFLLVWYMHGTTFSTLASAVQSTCMHPVVRAVFDSAPFLEMRTTVVPVSQILLKFLNHTFVADNLAFVKLCQLSIYLDKDPTIMNKCRVPKWTRC